jgi:hypothetical protein
MVKRKRTKGQTTIQHITQKTEDQATQPHQQLGVTSGGLLFLYLAIIIVQKRNVLKLLGKQYNGQLKKRDKRTNNDLQNI